MKTLGISTLFFVLLAPACLVAQGVGLVGKYYDNWAITDTVITFDLVDLVLERTDPNIDFWNAPDAYHQWGPVASTNWYGVAWTGYLHIVVPGDYGFGTMSDDGSQVWIDGQLVVDNREEQWWDWEDCIAEGTSVGLYPTGGSTSDYLTGPLYLATGYHFIEVRFYEARNYDGIELWWLKPGSGPSDIPYYGRSWYDDVITINSATNWEIIPPDAFAPSLVGIEEHELAGPLPAASMQSCYPNPFNPLTTIRFELREPSFTSLDVYDLAGGLVCRLRSGAFLNTGMHEVVWNGRDELGHEVVSGIYFCRLETPKMNLTKTVTLVR